MRRFAALYRRLDRSTATGDKRAALVDYFRDAPPRDAAWALWLLAGGKVGGAKARIASTGELRAWIAEESGNPDWLVESSHHAVGDLAETLALLLDDPDTPTHGSPTKAPLADWIEQRLVPVANADADTRRAVVVSAWRSLRFRERLVFNKLLTGALRVGVSPDWCRRRWRTSRAWTWRGSRNACSGAGRRAPDSSKACWRTKPGRAMRRCRIRSSSRRRWKAIRTRSARSTSGSWNGSGTASACS